MEKGSRNEQELVSADSDYQERGSTRADVINMGLSPGKLEVAR